MGEASADDKFSYAVGDMVAVDVHSRNPVETHIARVDLVHAEQGFLQVTLHHVPDTCRFGPWSRRQWTPWAIRGEVQTAVVDKEHILCRVGLTPDGSLTMQSIERLISHGIDLELDPRRDHLLPNRTVGRNTARHVFLSVDR